MSGLPVLVRQRLRARLLLLAVSALAAPAGVLLGGWLLALLWPDGAPVPAPTAGAASTVRAAARAAQPESLAFLAFQAQHDVYADRGAVIAGVARLDELVAARERVAADASELRELDLRIAEEAAELAARLATFRTFRDQLNATLGPLLALQRAAEEYRRQVEAQAQPIAGGIEDELVTAAQAELARADLAVAGVRDLLAWLNRPEIVPAFDGGRTCAGYAEALRDRALRRPAASQAEMAALIAPLRPCSTHVETLWHLGEGVRSYVAAVPYYLNVLDRYDQALHAVSAPPRPPSDLGTWAQRLAAAVVVGLLIGVAFVLWPEGERASPPRPHLRPWEVER